MIDVSEATKIIDSCILKLPKTQVPLEKALGRILRQDIVADTDFPPFNRVMMDGIAIKFDDYKSGQKAFNMAGIQAAGDPQLTLISQGDRLEVMTGAVAPKNSDVVVPYEDIHIDNEKQLATIKVDALKKGANIHLKGTDKKKGDLLITEGVVLDAPDIAVAASVGLSKLWVTKNPSVAIISTGNELVEIDESPLPHQIRRSNVYALAAELKHFGIKSDLYHCSDEQVALHKELADILSKHDVLLLSGGVSKGKFDFIPEVLEDLGVSRKFHRIAQKPGKPLWFGANQDKVVFAFPGNPVSTFLCYHKYFVPWLKKSLGKLRLQKQCAILAEDFTIKTKLTYFLQVKTSVNEHGQLMATPLVGKGSGDHANLVSSNAFLELPDETFAFKKGEVYDLIPFRNI